jgi:hypothetical protein
MRTTLELFVLATLDNENISYHRLAWDITDNDEDPDRILADRLGALLGTEKTDELYISSYDSVCCAHSTSWRYVDGVLVLTYLLFGSKALIVSLPIKTIKTDIVVPATASSPLSPRPQEIREEQVVTHGLGHLRFLMEKNAEPYVSQTVGKNHMMPILTKFASTPAGRLVNYEYNVC